jgi:iron complex outermembrane recepter protein
MDVNLKLNRARLMTSAATGLVLLFAGAPAIAQETTPADPAVESVEETVDADERKLDVVTVTGIRSSIENSLLTKRNSTSIVEAISAEDIGKLPDLSIADSLARLPGVTAQRVRGRAQQVSIRGLGPDFSIALLNGREQVSAGNNRGIEFDQFPSELVAQGIVYKTPDAKLAATGIAGAVDLRTVRPLSYDDRRINVSGQYIRNDNGSLNPDFDEDGNRFFASLIDQNADGTIGWSIGIVSQSNPTQFFSRELKTNQFQVSTDPVSGLIYPSDNPRTGVVSREFKRTSVAGTLQFEPTDRFQATIDAFFTDTEDAGIFRGVETPIASWSGAQFDQAIGSPPFADAAVYSAVVPILRTDTEGNTAEIFSIGFNTSYELTDRLTVSGDFARSELDRSDIDYESYAGTGGARSGPQDTLIFGFPSSGRYFIQSQLDYTDPSLIFLTDPGGWGQVGFIKQPKIDDELDQLRLEAEYDLDVPFIASVTGGVLLSEREKNFDSNESFIRAGTGFVATDPLNPSTRRLAIPAGSIIGSTDTGSIGLPIIAYNPGSFLTDGTYTLEKATFDTEWTVGEEIQTFYLMANIDGEFSGAPVRGNVGFQYVDTEQSSTGTLNFGGTQSLQTIENSYTNFLPSVNLSFEVAPDTFVRAAAAQTLTRPRLDQLAANQSLSFNSLICQDTNGDQLPDVLSAPVTPTTTCFSQGGGNPFLEPYRSTSFDLAFERFFDETTALSVAFFHKELSDWVIDQSVLVDGSQSIRAGGLGSFLDANPSVALTNLGGPTNFAEGAITGFEATLRANLDNYLPENLAGFGFSASYTYADNSLENDNGDTINIPGYSESVWSSDVYYENHGWRARLSARNRSDFLSEVQNFDGSLSGAQALDETILDAQIGYEWFEGPLAGFSVNLEAYNIGDEPFRTENDLLNSGGDTIGTFISRHEQYGTTYNLTVAKKF